MKNFPESVCGFMVGLKFKLSLVIFPLSKKALSSSKNVIIEFYSFDKSIDTIPLMFPQKKFK